MSQIPSLLELFRVDKSLRGLRSKLDAAEKFLSQQQQQLGDLEKQATTVEGQLKHLKASLANDEGEAQRLETRMNTLREQMNTAQTAKEYNAFLNELNSLKEQKGKVEEAVLTAMSRSEELSAKVQEISKDKGERTGIATSAENDRNAREAEIKERLSELTTQRQELAAKVPASLLKELERLIGIMGDDAMVPIEVLDRRAHEAACSACMMALPMEIVNGIVSGRVSQCPSCRAILYTEIDWMEKEKPKKKASTKKKAASKTAVGSTSES